MANILIVDDSRLILAHLKTELEALGPHTVSKASNGEEAFEVLEATTDLDLIFLDLQMPKMDGLTFLSLKRDGVHRDVPVVVITSQPPEEAKQSLELGARKVLRKPVERTALANALEDMGIK